MLKFLSTNQILSNLNEEGIQTQLSGYFFIIKFFRHKICCLNCTVNYAEHFYSIFNQSFSIYFGFINTDHCECHASPSPPNSCMQTFSTVKCIVNVLAGLLHFYFYGSFMKKKRNRQPNPRFFCAASENGTPHFIFVIFGLFTHIKVEH